MDLENQSNVANLKIVDQTPTKKLSQSQTPRTAVKKEFSTPKASAENRPKTAQTCSKLNLSASRAPFSPLSSTTSTCGNNAREAARVAKLQSTQERIQKVAVLKERWAQEKQSKTLTYKERRDLELKKLQQENETNAELRRKNLDKKKEFEEKEKEKEAELLKSSLETRKQLALDMEAKAKAKRRISVFVNNSIRQKALKKQAQLEQEKKQQEIEELQNRRLNTLSLREHKKLEEDKRRESLLNKTLKAQEEKKVQEELENARKEEEQRLLDTRHANWLDDQAYQQKVENLRRQSILNRLESWRQEKATEEQLENEKKNYEADLMKSRHEDHKNMKAYAEKLANDRRQSISVRLNKWREEKNLEMNMEEEKKIADEYERELQQQALEDVQQYQESMKESRRQSLAYRLDKARKDKDFESGQQALEQMVMEEEKRIQDLDRQDVQNYRQKIVDARRQSLIYRNQTEYQEKMRLEGERQAQMMADHADRELRDDAWRDVQQYLEEERSKQRRSLAWRLADSHRQHEIELQMHEENLNRIHLDLQCRREDWLSLQEHKKEESEKRRKSIALRLDSWRKHKMHQEKEKARLDMMAEEDAILREMDREELFAAKLAQDMIDRKNMISSNTSFVL